MRVLVFLITFFVTGCAFADEILVLGGGRASASVTPDQIANLDGWYKADDGVYSDAGCTTLATDGQDVQCWLDQTANNNDLTTVASAHPSYHDSLINSLPAVHFEETTGETLKNSVNGYNYDGSAGSTVFAIWKQHTPDSDSYIFTHGPFLNPGWFFRDRDTSGRKIEFGYSDSSGGFASVRTTTSLTATNVYYVIALYDGSKSASGFTIYINGTSDSLTTVNDNMTGSASTTTVAHMGSSNNTSSRFWDGDLLELGVYSREINASEITDLNSYLAGRAGL